MLETTKKDVLKKVVALFGLSDSVTIVEENITYEKKVEPHIWTVNDLYLLKQFNSEREMRNNTLLAKCLAKANVPTQKVMPSLEGQDYVCVEGEYFSLFTKIQGNVLKDYFAGDYLKRGYYLGQCVAQLHEGLKSITQELGESKKLWDNNMMEELKGWVSTAIEQYLPKSRLEKEEKEAFARIYKEVKEKFGPLYMQLPRHVIHRDIHGENMIFQDEQLVGYIDFDLTQINARLFDVCYLGTGSLASQFQNEESREKWLGFAHQVVCGYEQILPMTEAEKQSISYMFSMIQLIMVAYFADNHYEELADRNVIMTNWICSNWERGK